MDEKHFTPEQQDAYTRRLEQMCQDKDIKILRLERTKQSRPCDACRLHYDLRFTETMEQLCHICETQGRKMAKDRLRILIYSDYVKYIREAS